MEATLQYKDAYLSHGGCLKGFCVDIQGECSLILFCFIFLKQINLEHKVSVLLSHSVKITVKLQCRVDIKVTPLLNNEVFQKGDLRKGVIVREGIICTALWKAGIFKSVVMRGMVSDQSCLS